MQNPDALTREYSENDDLLENIRQNSVVMSERHRARYVYYLGVSKYFDIPILILSLVSSYVTATSGRWLSSSDSNDVAVLMTSIISLLTSIKLYLSIETNIQVEEKSAKAYYTLAVDIYRHQHLTHTLLEIEEFAETAFTQYMKLYEDSRVLHRRMRHDSLAPVSRRAQLDIELRPLESSTPPRLF